MPKQQIVAAQAPAAIGPYSQAIRAGGFVFFSGQIPLDPATMEIVGDTVAQQTEQVLRNIVAILQEAGLDHNSVIKTTILLADMADFAVVNEVYGSLFEKDPPARATYQVAALPKGAKVEIEAIAQLDKK